MHDVHSRWQAILESISLSAGKAGRNAGEIELMAVSKTHPYASISSLFACGQMMFGENRVQEAEQKFPVDRPRGMDLHLIGHLQSNKAKKAVSLFDAIDSVDSLKLAQKLESLLDKPLPILLEYKTAVNDSEKSGFETPDELFSALEQISSFRHLTVKGLMTIGPLGAGEKETRNAFALLCKTAQMARLRFPHLDFSTLSMGMSQDYGWAIEEGSTRIRIGSALFGAREYV